jgi:integrase/recombinase XerD
MPDVPITTLTEMAAEGRGHAATECDPSGLQPTRNLAENQRALTGYWAYLKRRGRTASTIARYAQTLPAFLEWWGDNPLTQIKPRDLDFWLIQWGHEFEAEHDREPSAAAQKSQVCALRGFFNYLERMEYLDKNPCRVIESPKVVRKPIQHLTDEEDTALLNAVISPQERILIPLLRFSGLRISEALNLRWADVLDGLIHVCKSKTPAGIRTVPVFEPLAQAMIPWERHQRALGLFASEQYLLATRNANRMTHQHAWLLIKRVADRAGIRPRVGLGVNTNAITPHTLRRQFATWLLGRGVRIEAISSVLGHSSPTVTVQSYAAWSQEKLMGELIAHVHRGAT